RPRPARAAANAVGDVRGDTRLRGARERGRRAARARRTSGASRHAAPDARPPAGSRPPARVARRETGHGRPDPLTDVALVRSELGAGDPRYTSLATLPLGGRQPGDRR